MAYGVNPNLPRGERTPQHWFNPAAFAIPPAVDPVTGLPRFGDAGRNTIVGPSLNNIDGSLTVGSINAVNKNMRQAQFAAEFRF
jgi:hypothetical protein